MAVLSTGKPPCSGLQGERGQDLCQHSHSLPCGESKYVSRHSGARQELSGPHVTSFIKVTYLLLIY